MCFHGNNESIPLIKENRKMARLSYSDLKRSSVLTNMQTNKFYNCEQDVDQASEGTDDYNFSGPASPVNISPQLQSSFMNQENSTSSVSSLCSTNSYLSPYEISNNILEPRHLPSPPQDLSFNGSSYRNEIFFRNSQHHYHYYHPQFHESIINNSSHHFYNSIQHNHALSSQFGNGSSAVHPQLYIYGLTPQLSMNCGLLYTNTAHRFN